MSYLRVRCPRCWQTAKISEDKLGRQGMCNRCGSPVTIPTALTKVCVACGDEVTQVKHYKDQQNNYLCGDCYAEGKGAADRSAFSIPTLTCSICHSVFSQGDGQDRDGQPICRDCHRRDMPPLPRSSRKGKRREKERGKEAEGDVTAIADPDSVLSFLDTPDPHRFEDKSPPSNGEHAAEKPPAPAVDDAIRAQIEAEAAADEARDRLMPQRSATPPQPTTAPAPAHHHEHHEAAESDTLITFDDDVRRPFTRVVTRTSPFASFAAGGALLGVIVLLMLQLASKSAPDADDVALRAISLLAQAEAYCAAGRYEEGIRRYDRLMKFIDGKPASSAALAELIETAKVDYQRAHEAYRQQQADEAARLVTRQREKQEQQEQEKLVADLRHAVASLQQTIESLRSANQLPPVAKSAPVEVPIPSPPASATVKAPVPATAPVQPPASPASTPAQRGGRSIFDD